MGSGISAVVRAARVERLSRDLEKARSASRWAGTEQRASSMSHLAQCAMTRAAISAPHSSLTAPWGRGLRRALRAREERRICWICSSSRVTEAGSSLMLAQPPRISLSVVSRRARSSGVVVWEGAVVFCVFILFDFGFLIFDFGLGNELPDELFEEDGELESQSKARVGGWG